MSNPLQLIPSSVEKQSKGTSSLQDKEKRKPTKTSKVTILDDSQGTALNSSIDSISLDPEDHENSNGKVPDDEATELKDANHDQALQQAANQSTTSPATVPPRSANNPSKPFTAALKEKSSIFITKLCAKYESTLQLLISYSTKATIQTIYLANGTISSHEEFLDTTITKPQPKNCSNDSAPFLESIRLSPHRCLQTTPSTVKAL